MEAFGRVFEGRESSALEWLTALGAGPGVVDFTGGEPTLYSEWAALTAGLAKGQWTWALTSSLCFRLALEETNWTTCRVVTASYHYKDWYAFRANLRYVRDRVADVRCTLVASPKNLVTQVRPAMETLAAEGVKVNIHPLLKMNHVWPDAAWAEVQALDANVVREIPPRWPESRAFPRCDAGVDYCFVDADLSVYRCYSQWLDQRPIAKLGNPLPALRQAPCGRPCVFPCDVQIAEKSQCSRSR